MAGCAVSGGRCWLQAPPGQDGKLQDGIRNFHSLLLSTKALMTPAPKNWCHSTSSPCSKCSPAFPSLRINLGNLSDAFLALINLTAQFQRVHPTESFALHHSLPHQTHMEGCAQALSREGGRKSSWITF